MRSLPGLSRDLASRWWIVAVVVALCLSAAAFFTSRQPTVYRASTLLLVKPDSTVAEPVDQLRSLETLERRTILATFARLVDTDRLRKEANAELGRGKASDRFRVESSIVPNTNLIRIMVTGPDPDGAAALANALARTTRSEARRTYPIFTMELVEPASAQHGPPAAPSPRRNYAVALVLGLFVGLGAAFVATGSEEDDRITSS